MSKHEHNVNVMVVEDGTVFTAALVAADVVGWPGTDNRDLLTVGFARDGASYLHLTMTRSSAEALHAHLGRLLGAG